MAQQLWKGGREEERGLSGKGGRGGMKGTLESAVGHVAAEGCAG